MYIFWCHVYFVYTNSCTHRWRCHTWVHHTTSQTPSTHIVCVFACSWGLFLDVNALFMMSFIDVFLKIKSALSGTQTLIARYLTYNIYITSIFIHVSSYPDFIMLLFNTSCSKGHMLALGALPITVLADDFFEVPWCECMSTAIFLKINRWVCNVTRSLKVFAM